MKLCRCPICHAHITLEAIAQDDAARELLGILAGLDGELGRALIQYLGLFRPPARDLSHDRALRLTREVLALSADAQRLAHAMRETLLALRSKGAGKPLGNHNYLAKVLDSVTVPRSVYTVEPALPVLPTRRSPIDNDTEWAK